MFGNVNFLIHTSDCLGELNEPTLNIVGHLGRDLSLIQYGTSGPSGIVVIIYQIIHPKWIN